MRLSIEAGSSGTEAGSASGSGSQKRQVTGPMVGLLESQEMEQRLVLMVKRAFKEHKHLKIAYWSAGWLSQLSV